MPGARSYSTCAFSSPAAAAAADALAALEEEDDDDDEDVDARLPMGVMRLPRRVIRRDAPALDAAGAAAALFDAGAPRDGGAAAAPAAFSI